MVELFGEPVSDDTSVIEEDKSFVGKYIDRAVDVGEGIADIGQGMGAGLVDIVQKKL
mgnify:FL=1